MMRSSFATVDAVATSLLASAGLGLEPPIPVFQLARRLGASQVADADLGLDDGRLEVVDDRIVISVRADMSLERKRFTVAHEIGHLLLAHADFDLGRVRREPRLRDDETFCDRLAESLLMPATWVRGRYLAAPPGLDVLVNLALTARVSVAAASIRLTRVARWRRLVVRWRRRGPAWQVESVTGYLGAPLRTLETAPTTATVIERVRHDPAGRARTALPLRVSGIEYSLPAELWVAGRSALAVIDPLATQARAGSTIRPAALERPHAANLA